MTSLLKWKSGLTRGVVSLEGDNLVVFYYLSVHEIWPDKRAGLWWRWPYTRGPTVQVHNRRFIIEFISLIYTFLLWSYSAIILVSTDLLWYWKLSQSVGRIICFDVIQYFLNTGLFSDRICKSKTSCCWLKKFSELFSYIWTLTFVDTINKPNLFQRHKCFYQSKAQSFIRIDIIYMYM